MPHKYSHWEYYHRLIEQLYKLFDSQYHLPGYELKANQIAEGWWAWYNKQTFHSGGFSDA